MTKPERLVAAYQTILDLLRDPEIGANVASILESFTPDTIPTMLQCMIEEFKKTGDPEFLTK